ncbi:MAG: peptide-binding protein [Candidatus Wallbacteria bacterium]|nr:peptide-binding protein [Candidatus Wallbacteria bacterium]
MKLSQLICIFMIFFTAGCGSNKADTPSGSAQPGTGEVSETTTIATENLDLDLSPAYGDTLIEHALSDAVILNPLIYTDSPSGDIISLVYNGLVKRNQNLELVGDLASSFEVSAGGQLITFYLRKGVKWHDGEDFTAADVKFTYDKIMDPATKTADRDNFILIDSFEIVDPYTVKMHYKEPFAPALVRWSIGIIPKHIFEKENINTSKYNKQPIGTGPYKFVEWTPDEQIRLEAFDKYFDGKPYINRYVYKIIPDETMAFLALKRNELDTMGLDPERYEKQAKSREFLSRFNIYTYPSISFYTYIGYNLLNPVFSDKRVRKALTLATDRQAIIDNVLLGHGQTLSGPFAPTDWAYDQSIKPLPYDLAAARKLLAEAGWSDSNNDGFLEKDGRRFSFTLSIPNGKQTFKLIAQLTQDCWKSIGIEVKIEQVEWTVLMKMCDDKNFDSMILGWSQGLDPDHYSIWHSSQIPDMPAGKNGNNYMSYINPEADRLWEQGRTTFDLELRKQIYHKLHSIIHEDQPYTFLYVTDAIVAVDNRIHGIKVAPSGIYYNLEKWYVPKKLQKY